MTTGRRAVAFTPMETRPDVIIRTAQLAEELGYEAVVVPEGWGLDATLVLAALAQCTRRITLTSGVLSVWGRTPATLAMSAATMHQISGGRYVLGLGASSPALVQGFHGRDFTHPAAQLRTVTAEVRTLLAGGRPSVTNARPVRLGLSPTPELPIWLAAVRPHALRVVAEVADGWLPAWLGRDTITQMRPALDETRRTAGLRAGQLTVAGGPITVAAQPAIARAHVSNTVAFYMSAMGDWAQLTAEHGHAEAVQAVVAANPKPHPTSGVVPDHANSLLDEFTAYGTPDQVAQQLAAWDAAVDIVSIGLPPYLSWAVIETTLRAAAPN